MVWTIDGTADGNDGKVTGGATSLTLEVHSSTFGQQWWFWRRW